MDNMGDPLCGIDYSYGVANMATLMAPERRFSFERVLTTQGVLPSSQKRYRESPFFASLLKDIYSLSFDKDYPEIDKFKVGVFAA